MIGEEVIHNEFGLGTIIGFEDNKCAVKYERFMDTKMMPFRMCKDILD